MLITEVTFTAINRKCVSLKPFRYMIRATDKDAAIDLATTLLSTSSKHADKYKPECRIIGVHEI